MEQRVCCDNKSLLSFIFQKRRHDKRATLHGKHVPTWPLIILLLVFKIQ